MPVFRETLPAKIRTNMDEKAKLLYDIIQKELQTKANECNCECVQKYIEIGLIVKEIYKNVCVK